MATGSRTRLSRAAMGSGITVVTRDYSLFENPVTVDYFTSE
ncbi:MAG: hypothetical protein WCC99_07450 [Candidatus Sulfotelmatobacter sp.]